MKRIKKLIASLVLATTLIGGATIVANAGTIIETGNRCCYSGFKWYAYAWTQSKNSWASTTTYWHYSDGSPRNKYKVGYAYDSMKPYGKAWAQTNTHTMYNGLPDYSKHTCNSYSMYKEI